MLSVRKPYSLFSALKDVLSILSIMVLPLLNIYPAGLSFFSHAVPRGVEEIHSRAMSCIHTEAFGRWQDLTEPPILLS